VTAKRKFKLLFIRMRKWEMKSDEVDDEIVITSVSPGRVTATLCTEKLFLSTQYIQLASQIRQVEHEG
jgi:hypothetical protein